MCTSAAARETRKTLNSIVALAHGRAARAALDLTHRAARRPDGTMSEDRVSLSEDRHLLGVKNAAGDVIRAKSPNLKKAMGKLGIMKEDLVPPLRETFAEECKRDGVSIPDVIQKRWEVMEQRRLNEIDEVVQKARLSFTQAHRKITFCFLRSSLWASAALAQAPDTRPVNSLRVRLRYGLRRGRRRKL